MQTFTYSSLTNVFEEGEWLLAVTSFEATNSVFFSITNENSSFSISITGCWRFRNHLEEEIMDKLKKLLKLRSENNVEWHVEEVRQRGKKTKVGDRE